MYLSVCVCFERKTERGRHLLSMKERQQSCENLSCSSPCQPAPQRVKHETAPTMDAEEKGGRHQEAATRRSGPSSLKKCQPRQPSLLPGGELREHLRRPLGIPLRLSPRDVIAVVAARQARWQRVRVDPGIQIKILMPPSLNPPPTTCFQTSSDRN